MQISTFRHHGVNLGCQLLSFSTDDDGAPKAVDEKVVLERKQESLKHQLGACGALTERIVSGLDSWLLPFVTWFQVLSVTNLQCRVSHFPHTRPPISHSKQFVCRCRATDARISAAFAGHAQGCVLRAEYAILRFPTPTIPSIRTDEWPTHAPLFLCAKIHVSSPPRTFSCPAQLLKKRNGKTSRWWPT
jgi:hypothetical protein